MDITSQAPTAVKTSRSTAWRQLVITLARLAIGLGILVYLVRSGKIELHSLRRLPQVWPLTVLGVGVFLLDILFMSMRLSVLFRAHQLSMSLWNAIQLTLISFFFSAFLPGAAGGDLAKLYYATRENQGRRTEVATVLLFDRVIGLFSIVLLPLLVAPFFLKLLVRIPALRHVLWIDGMLATAVFGGVTLVMFSKAFRIRLSRLLERWDGARKIAERIMETVGVYGKARGILAAAMGLSLLATLALIASTGLGLYTVNPAALSMKICLVAPIGHLMNSLPLTPGGIGVGEGAFNALFSLAGISGGADALLCLRIWSLLVGTLGLLGYVFGVGRIVHLREPRHAEGDAAISFEANAIKVG
jgi:glycosyltransferase 2 family protein